MLKSINDIARNSGRALRSNLFGQQNEGEAKILQVHIDSIQASIGSEVSQDTFQIAGINTAQAKQIYKILLEEEKVIRDFRLSKKVSIGYQVLIFDKELILRKIEFKIKMERELIELLAQNPQGHNQSMDIIIKSIEEKLKNLNLLREKIENYNLDKYFKYDVSTTPDIKTHQIFVDILQQLKIIQEGNIFYGNRLVIFPVPFNNCQNSILSYFQSLISSNNRTLDSKFIEAEVYTLEKFQQDTENFIQEVQYVEIRSEIQTILIGKQDHVIFQNQGNKIQQILQKLSLDQQLVKYKYLAELIKEQTNLQTVEIEQIFNYLQYHKKITINFENLCQSIDDAQNQFIFFKSQNSIRKFFSGETQIYLNGEEFQLQNNQSYDFINLEEALKIVIFSSKQKKFNFEESNNFQALKNELGFNEIEQLNAVQRNCYFSFQNETEIDPNQIILEQELGNGDNRKQIQKCLDWIHDPQEKQDFNIIIKEIYRLIKDFNLIQKQKFIIDREQVGVDQISFEKIKKLLQSRGFIKERQTQEKIQEELQQIQIRNDLFSKQETKEIIKNLDFSILKPFQKRSEEIKEILYRGLDGSQLTNLDFQFQTAELFQIFRAFLVDADLVQETILYILNQHRKSITNNPELQQILYQIYKSNGKINKKFLYLKDAKWGFQELISKLQQSGVVKSPQMVFQCGDSIQTYQGVVEKVLSRVLNLQRNRIRQVLSYLPFGDIDNEQNEERDQKKEAIMQTLKNVIGQIKIYQKIRVEPNDLPKYYGELQGPAPPQMLDFIRIQFDKIIEFKEDKCFDWNCFLVALIGVAQICIGIAIEIFSGGTLHFLAQGFIQEGIGDIVFAIQSSIHGNFSWKNYLKHQIQSVIITIISCGVGALLSKGAQATKMAIGLATKSAIAKSCCKELFKESLIAISSAFIDISSEELSKTVMEEISKNFKDYYEEKFLNSNQFLKKTSALEQKILEIYSKFGTYSQRYIDEQIEQTIHKAKQGTLASKIINSISQVVGGVIGGFDHAISRFEKGHSKAALLKFIKRSIDISLKGAEFANNFQDISQINYVSIDQMQKNLESLERELYSMVQNGTLQLDDQNITREKKEISFSTRAKNQTEKFQLEVQETFLSMVRQSFVQPGIQKLLTISFDPIKQALIKNYGNGIQGLKQQIEENSQRLIQGITRNSEHGQNEMNSNLTARKKKGLEQLGLIDCVSDEILQEKVCNFGKKSLRELQNIYGDQLRVLATNGKFIAIVPTHQQYANHIAKGKYSGPIHIQAICQQENCSIFIVNSSKLQIQNNEIFNHDGKAMNNCEQLKNYDDINLPNQGQFDCTQNLHKDQKQYYIMWISGENQQIGHYAAIYKGQEGSLKIFDIQQNDITQGQCLTQAFLASKQFNNQQPTNQEIQTYLNQNNQNKKLVQFNNNLGRFVLSNSQLKNLYQNGVTIHHSFLIGGGPKINGETDQQQQKYQRATNNSEDTTEWTDFCQNLDDVKRQDVFEIPPFVVDCENPKAFQQGMKKIVQLLQKQKSSNRNSQKPLLISAKMPFCKEGTTDYSMLQLVIDPQNLYVKQVFRDGKSLLESGFETIPNQEIIRIQYDFNQIAPNGFYCFDYKYENEKNLSPNQIKQIRLDTAAIIFAESIRFKPLLNFRVEQMANNQVNLYTNHIIYGYEYNTDPTKHQIMTQQDIIKNWEKISKHKSGNKQQTIYDVDLTSQDIRQYKIFQEKMKENSSS